MKNRPGRDGRAGFFEEPRALSPGLRALFGSPPKIAIATAPVRAFRMPGHLEQTPQPAQVTDDHRYPSEICELQSVGEELRLAVAE